MNKVILMGRLTRDPDVRRANNEEATAVSRWTLAVNRRVAKIEKENNADFISCIAFGRQAEFVEKYFRQGMRMILSGRIQTGSYVNKDAKKVYTTDIVAEEIEFAESKGKSDNPSSSGNMGQAADNSGFASFTDCEDEDGLPFN